MQNPQGFSQRRGGCALLLPLVGERRQSTNWSRSNPAWSCSTLRYSPQPPQQPPLAPPCPLPPSQPRPLATKWRPHARAASPCCRAGALRKRSGRPAAGHAGSCSAGGRHREAGGASPQRGWRWGEAPRAQRWPQGAGSRALLSHPALWILCSLTWSPALLSIMSLCSWSGVHRYCELQLTNTRPYKHSCVPPTSAFLRAHNASFPFCIFFFPLKTDLLRGMKRL